MVSSYSAGETLYFRKIADFTESGKAPFALPPDLKLDAEPNES